MNQALAALKPDARTARPPELTFPELQATVGFPEYWEAEIRYKTT